MKAFKITSVTAFAGILLLLPVFLSAQIRVEKQLFVEIKDTVETAYLHYYTDNMVQNGFYVSKEIKKKVVGLDSIRITRMFYLEQVPVKSDNKLIIEMSKFKKVFIDFEIRKYLSERKGNDFPKEYAN